MDTNLQILLKNRPSIIRNSLIVWLVWIPFWILAPFFTIVGFGFVFGADLQQELIFNPLVNEGQISIELAYKLHQYSRITGIALLILGALSFLVVWLCRKLFERNLFLMELEDWKYENEDKEQKTSDKNNEKSKSISKL